MMITITGLLCGMLLLQSTPGQVALERTSKAVSQKSPIAAKDRSIASPLRGESMRHYLRRVSQQSGVIFVCPESCLNMGTSSLAGANTPVKVAQALARSVKTRVLVSGNTLIISEPLNKEEQCRTNSELEFCRDAYQKLEFANSFTPEQLDLMANQGDLVTLDQLTPHQQELFWKADSSGESKGWGYITQVKHIPFPAKDLRIGICRTKSLRLWDKKDEPLSWYGIFSHTSGGPIVTKPYAKNVVAVHPPTKSRVPVRVSDAAAHKEVMARCKNVHSLNIDTDASLAQGIGVIRRKSAIPISVDAPYKNSKPFISTNTLPADRWLQISLLFTGLHPRREENYYHVTRIQMGKYLLDTESHLLLIDSIDPALSTRYRKLVTSVSAKLNRLPYPKTGIPFFAGDFAPMLTNRRLYRMNQLTPEQQRWIRWFADSHPDRISEYDQISFADSRLELKDTLWIYGRVTQSGYSHGFSEMLNN